MVGWLDKCIKKMWYVLSMEYYSVVRKKGILSYTSELLCLEDITLSETSKKYYDKLHLYGTYNILKFIGI